jgi:hypothetical protein
MRLRRLPPRGAPPSAWQSQIRGGRWVAVRGSMNQGAAVALVLLAAAIAANLPFVNERLFVVGPKRVPAKALAWRLLELLLMFVLVLGIGFALETRIGQRQAQGWEFYIAAFCLFVTLAFPGFVWRVLRRRRHG